MTSGITVKHQASPEKDMLTKALEAADELVCKVGWLSSSIYPKTQIPAAYVASIHEYGYAPKNIPPRLGMRETVIEKKSEWNQKVAKIGKRLVSGKIEIRGALELVGQIAVADIFKHISEVTSPPLAEATIEARRKKSLTGEARTDTGSKPLNDTGYMISTLQYWVSANKGDGE